MFQIYELLPYYIGIAVVIMIPCIKLDFKFVYLFLFYVNNSIYSHKQQEITIIIINCASFSGSPRAGELK